MSSITGSKVNAIAIFQNGRLAVGGDFTACAAVCTNYVVLNETTGASTADGGIGADGIVNTIVSSGTMVFAGGAFFNFMGNVATRIAAIDAANPAVFFGELIANDEVYSFSLDATHCYVAGNFTSLGGVNLNSVGRILLANGIPDPTWAPVFKSIMYGANPPITSIYASDTRIYFSGPYTHVNGETRITGAAVDKTTGTTTVPINLNISSHVLFTAIGIKAFAESGGNLFVGGTLNSIGGVGRPTIAEIDLTTGVPTSWIPVLDTPLVLRVLVAGDLLYIHGLFTTVNGQARPGVAAFDLSGPTPTLTAWDPSPVDAQIGEIEVNSTSVFVYGGFTTIGGQPRNKLAAFAHGSNTPNAWQPTVDTGLSAWVFDAMFAYEDSVYFTGGFTLVNGVDARAGAAEVDSVTGATKPWNPDLGGGTIGPIVRVGSRVLVSGTFTTINGGTPRQYLAATHSTTGADLGWNPNPDFHVNSVTVVGDQFYVGGNFYNIAGGARKGTARFAVSDLSLSSWTHSLDMYSSLKFFTVDGDLDNSVYGLGIVFGNSLTGEQTSLSMGVSRFNATDGTWLPPQ